jgi:DNA-binding XRE family transcriptional regulator
MENNIAELLKKNNISQRDFAKKLDITEISVSRYITGSRIPNIATCIKMAEVLNCKIEDIYCYDSKSNNHNEVNETRYEWSKDIVNKIAKAECLDENEIRMVEIALRGYDIFQEILNECTCGTSSNIYDLKYKF